MYLLELHNIFIQSIFYRLCNRTMPRMFNRLSCSMIPYTPLKIPTSTNNTNQTRSMRLSQLTKTSRYSVNRTVTTTG